MSAIAARTILALTICASSSMSPAAAEPSMRLGLDVIDSPGALEPVVLRALFPGCTAVDGVEFSDGEFRVKLASTLCGVPPEGQFSQDISLGRLPAGRYRVRLYSSGSNESPIGEPPLELSVAAKVPNPALQTQGSLDLGGVWWNLQRSGESFFIQHEAQKDSLLVAWNRYNSDGRPEWLVAVSTGRTDSGYTCELYRPSLAGLQRIGTLSLGDSITTHLPMTPNGMEASAKIGSTVTTIQLQRYRFAR